MQDKKKVEKVSWLMTDGKRNVIKYDDPKHITCPVSNVSEGVFIQLVCNHLYSNSTCVCRTIMKPKFVCIFDGCSSKLPVCQQTFRYVCVEKKVEEFEMFKNPIFEPDAIESTIKESKEVYEIAKIEEITEFKEVVESKKRSIVIKETKRKRSSNSKKKWKLTDLPEELVRIIFEFLDTDAVLNPIDKYTKKQMFKWKIPLIYEFGSYLLRLALMNYYGIININRNLTPPSGYDDQKFKIYEAWIVGALFHIKGIEIKAESITVPNPWFFEKLSKIHKFTNLEEVNFLDLSDSSFSDPSQKPKYKNLKSEQKKELLNKLFGKNNVKTIYLIGRELYKK